MNIVRSHIPLITNSHFIPLADGHPITPTTPRHEYILADEIGIHIMISVEQNIAFGTNFQVGNTGPSYRVLRTHMTRMTSLVRCLFSFLAAITRQMLKHSYGVYQEAIHEPAKYSTSRIVDNHRLFTVPMFRDDIAYEVYCGNTIRQTVGN